MPRLYYGWWIVLSAFACAMLVVGSTNYAFGLFVKPVAEDLGLSRADANTGLALLMGGVALFSPFIGRLLDRYPKPRVILGGAVLFAIGFATLALATSPWIMAAALALPAAAGTASCGAFAASTTVARWFRRNRGKALGFVAVSSSAGGFIVVPLVARSLTEFGWRTTLLLQAAVVLVVIGLLALLVIRDAPAELPESEAVPEVRSEVPAAAEERVWTVPTLLRDRNFWCILGSVGLMLAIDAALLASLPAYGTDIGFSVQESAFLMSMLTASAIAGKAGVGFLADKVDKRWLMTAVAVCNLLFVLVLLVQPGYMATLLICGVIGLAIGGALPVFNALVADHFGSRCYGLAMGTMAPLKLPLTIVALRFVGESFDRTGSYDLAFKVFMAGAVLSIVLIALVRRRPAPVLAPRLSGAAAE